MNRTLRTLAAAATTCMTLLAAANAHAFRMIQNTSSGRTSFGGSVPCDAPGGFAHWTRSGIEFRLNPANQGGEPGVVAALQAALQAWTDVTPAGYQLAYAGTTSAGYQTDGINTVLWASGNGCTGGCLALTALVLGPGQVINEADVSFNNDFDWNTNGRDYDVQAIAAHELGHCLGIHHTDLTKPRNRPTMYASYFGLDGRSLEADDKAALNCSFSRYPPAGAAVASGLDPSDPGDFGPGSDPEDSPVHLISRLRAGVSTLRFALREPGAVRLEVFDVAGRRVATLARGARGAGEYEIAWNGETAAGLAQRGVYFARIETPEGSSGATVILAR